ncbi:hypothetical protein CANCADRAFT_2052 [Tortispora caseinolytica NRRL Y-17796]|uniref:Ubiquitin carboxyl-terminal hydrolase n=1 Tax=Tortispora caseinolytica NRRL Y-17796 TaxID=767744 RepID=A0A1E4TEW9_9ASCO|nr:hypothetical protein CANCADRAFT_2052 [Tortispora caseinolytica NRRL Y-17796]
MKYFVPLECNPDVFNRLAHSMGVPDSMEFVDVYSLSQDMLEFVPRPAHALILVFPVSPAYEEYRHTQDADRPEYSLCGDQEDALWFKQTIGNACGTYALIHASLNGDVQKSLIPGSFFENLLKQAAPADPLHRTEILEQSKELETLHSNVAQSGDTEAPAADSSIDLHYVCFTKSAKTGHIFELDGRRKGPIDLGPLESPEHDVLSSEVTTHVQAFIDRESASGNPNFSMIALVSKY